MQHHVPGHLSSAEHKLLRFKYSVIGIENELRHSGSNDMAVHLYFGAYEIYPIEQSLAGGSHDTEKDRLRIHTDTYQLHT